VVRIPEGQEPYIIERYDADSIRYFLTINGPEKRDADFSWREFIYKHNGELLGVFGNLVNRSLTFISKYFGGEIPKGVIEENIKNNILSLYEASSKEIEKGQFKNALEDILSLARYANKYFDEKQPWLQIKEDAEKCAITLYNCIQIIANLSNLLTPFIPFSCDKIRGFLGIDKPKWSYIEIPEGCSITEPELLFQRIDKKVIDEEVQKLKVQNS
jgi:methionyl-tRNA synthetase